MTNYIIGGMKYFIFGFKIVVILALISAGYFFGYLKPHQAKMMEYSAHASNLIQNRTAYVNLAKLDPKSADFDIQKANLIDIIRSTNAKGLESPVNDEEKRILLAQNAILTKVFATSSYEDGVAILKSSESVKLLTDEASLIEKYRNY